MSDKADKILPAARAGTGVSATTGAALKRVGENAWEARQGFALFGSANMTDAEFEACGGDPFSPLFRDNYARGTGPTEAAAYAALVEDLRKTADGLWG